MKRTGAMVVLVLVGFVALGAQQMGAPQTGGDEEFVAYDVIVECGVGLGAWQVEVHGGEGMELTGVEGGQGVYSEPSYYDEAALQARRVVIGDFSLEDELPSGRVRVARLHFFASGGAGAVEGVLETAGDRAGNRIEARVELVRVVEGEGEQT